MRPQSMELYARLCGWTLARAHARSSDRIAIAAYLGGATRFDNAVADFAETYADQNERDHAALQAAVAEGRVQAQSGV
jgi:2-keto-4-pentenoate hydratase